MEARQELKDEKMEMKSVIQAEIKEPVISSEFSIISLKEILKTYDQIKSSKTRAKGDHEDITKLREFCASITKQKEIILTDFQLFELFEIVRTFEPNRHEDKLTAREFVISELKKKLYFEQALQGIEKLKQLKLDTPRNLRLICLHAKQAQHIIAILNALDIVHFANQTNLDKLFNMSTFVLGYITKNRLVEALTLLHDTKLATQEIITILLQNPFDTFYIANTIIKLSQPNFHDILNKILNSNFLVDLAYIINTIPFVLDQNHLNILLEKEKLSKYFSKAIKKADWHWFKTFSEEDLNVFFNYPKCALNYVLIRQKLNEAKPTLDTSENIAKLRYYVANSEFLHKLLNKKPEVTQQIFDDSIKEVLREMKISFLKGMLPKESKRDDCNPSHVWKFFGYKERDDKMKILNDPIGDVQPIRIIFGFL